MKLYVALGGAGAITSVLLDGKPWEDFTQTQVRLPFDAVTAECHVFIARGGSEADANVPVVEVVETLKASAATRVERFIQAMSGRNVRGYEYSHACLARDAYVAAELRQRRIAEGKIAKLPAEASQKAADELYRSTAEKLEKGLEKAILSYEKSQDPQKRKILDLWKKSQQK